MNISQWPLGKIMQLPDHCFGRRYLISCSLSVKEVVIHWDISELAFPEVCVVWELVLQGTSSTPTLDIFRLALGDQLPTTVAMMDGLEPVFNGLGLTGPGPRGIWVPTANGVAFTKLRMPLRTAGRRLVLELGPGQVERVSVICGLVVSAIPKDIPSCFNLD